MAKLTANTLRTKWHGADRWISDGGARGAGRLVARITRDGPVFYYQYFNGEGRKRFYPLGDYDMDGKRGLTLSTARDRAAELSALYRGGTTDLHGHFERQREDEERARKDSEAAARLKQEEAKRSTLKQLLEAYVGYLERSGKESARAVKNTFNRHVFEAAPHLAASKASEVTVDDFVDLIGALVEEDKGRTAAKLRSYLRAAYALALRSRTDPAAPLAMRTFGIKINPVASVGALSQFNRARTRKLSAEELVAFMKRLDALPDSVQKDAVRLCILLGGQRPAQLLRVRPVDLDLSAGTVTLSDSKGARRQPRAHVVPLTKEAKTILSRRLEMLKDGSPVFSVYGKTVMRADSLSGFVSKIASEMVEAKEAREPFQLRDVRRTVETMLAGIGVSSDIRAQLQSHGLGGVQLRHYNHHDYMPEKRRALEQWTRHLERLKSGKAGNVVSLHQRQK